MSSVFGSPLDQGEVEAILQRKTGSRVMQTTIGSGNERKGKKEEEAITVASALLSLLRERSCKMRKGTKRSRRQGIIEEERR